MGCLKKSAGCAHCYAILVAWRMMHNPNPKIAKKFAGTVRQDAAGNLNWTGRINFDEDTLLLPLKWRLPRRIFVNSLSDLFHPNVRDQWIDRAFGVMALCPHHTFQILTKHPERALKYMTEWPGGAGRQYCVMSAAHKLLNVGKTGWSSNDPEYQRARDAVIPRWPLPNVWLGTSCEDQKAADERIPLLLETPAAVRWVSAEPLLGPIDLRNLKSGTLNALDGIDFENIGDIRDVGDLSKSEIPGLNWIVVGGESGPGARPMHPDWARSLRDQCVAAGVPFFFKQFGDWLEDLDCAHLPAPKVADPLDYFEDHNFYDDPGRPFNPTTVYKVGKKAAGRLLDGKEWSEYPKELPV